MAIEVRDDPPQGRYEVLLDDALGGFAAYRIHPGLIAFIHTEIDERLEGRGLGSALMRGTLDDVRARGLEVLPFCPFVNGYIRRHAEYAELVPAAQRGRFGLASAS